jgi:hypothetical protein
MRTPIASALLVVFGLVFFAHSGAAQSSPIPSQPQSPQQTAQKPPSNPKLLPLPAAQVVLLPKQDGSASDPSITLQELRTWTQAQQNLGDGAGLMRFGDRPDAPKCAHIRIIQAPEMDSEMVVEAPPGAGGNITTFQGLPPCRRDLPTPMTAQRFYGVPPKLPVLPRAPFVQRPASQVPSAQPRFVQPKTDAPSPKP